MCNLNCHNKKLAHLSAQRCRLPVSAVPAHRSALDRTRGASAAASDGPRSWVNEHECWHLCGDPACIGLVGGLEHDVIFEEMRQQDLVMHLGPILLAREQLLLE